LSPQQTETAFFTDESAVEDIGGFMALDESGDEFETDSVSSSCTITNLLQPFAVVSITRTGVGPTTVDLAIPARYFRYVVLSADELSTDTMWAAQSYTLLRVGPDRHKQLDGHDHHQCQSAVLQVERINGNVIAAGEKPQFDANIRTASCTAGRKQCGATLGWFDYRRGLSQGNCEQHL